MDLSQPAEPARQRFRLGGRGRRWFDLAVVGVLLLPVPVFLYSGTPVSWTLFSLAHTVPLLWRRRHPVPVFAVVAITSLVQAVVMDNPLFSDVVFPVATYSIARFGRWRPAAGALVVGLVGAAVAAVDWLGPYAPGVSVATFTPYFLTIAAIVVTAWALGTAGRTRQAYVDALVERGERLEREAAQQAALAAIEERSRIAREMHDVVAHGLSVIVVQADGARYASARDPAIAATTLGTIAATGRESLTEMRRLLGLLRSDDNGSAPMPRLGDLAALVDEARSAGTDVSAQLPAATATVPDGAALTAYRVVQEALSNVRKHAGVATASVVVDVDQGALRVVVDDDGRGAGADDDGAGLGLVGMRERVAVHDGTLQAGPRPGGGYRVTATIPL